MKPVLLFLAVSFALACGPCRHADAAGTAGDRFKSPTQRARYSEHLKALFEAGEDRHPRAVMSIRRHASAARRIKRDDPRLDYAHGLVLLRHFKFSEATAKFRTASEADNRIYLPACKARVRTLLQMGDAAMVLQDVERLARAAGDANTTWFQGSRPSDAARWLGRVMGFLGLPDVDLVEPQKLVELDERVRALLEADLESAYLAGLASIQRERDHLERDLREELASVAARQKDRAEQKLSDIQERKEDLQKQSENIKLSAEEWEVWLKERLDDTDKQLQRLQKDFVVLDRVARVVSTRILQIQVELGQLQAELQSRNAARSRQGGQLLLQSQVQPLALEQELVRNQLQYGRLLVQANRVIGQAAAVKAARAAAVNKYQRATGKLVEQDAAVKRWNKMLKQSALKAAAEKAEKPSRATLWKRLTLPSTYFELHFEIEKERILNSYDVTSVAQQSK